MQPVQSIAQHIFRYDIVAIFGCASTLDRSGLSATVVLSLSLSAIWRRGLRPRAPDERHVDMRLLPQERIDQRALAELPPLIKGYLRLVVSSVRSCVDYDFNTTDVSIVVKTDLVTDKYFKHYERKSRRNGDEEET